MAHARARTAPKWMRSHAATADGWDIEMGNASGTPAARTQTHNDRSQVRRDRGAWKPSASASR
eukprot:9487423-Alexandrium_andersonii.AAC.1